MDPNKNGRFRLILVDASRQPWRGDTLVRIENDAERRVYEKRAMYDGPVTFTNLHTAPRGRHMLHIKTTMHAPLSRYILVDAGARENIVVPLLIRYRRADKHGHRIPFPMYEELEENGLKDVKAVLSDPKPTMFKSDRSGIRTNAGPEYYDTLIRTKRDNDGHRRIACVLNLYAKMKGTAVDDADDGLTAWDLIHQIFSIEQDRVFATVNPGFDVPKLLARLGASKRFKDYDACTHDIEPPHGYQKSDRTYKTVDDYGSLQLTFSQLEGDGDGAKWIVDADIDEKTGAGHWLEVTYHWLTGARTNPYAVHQLLCLQGLRPAYELITEDQS